MKEWGMCKIKQGNPVLMLCLILFNVCLCLNACSKDESETCLLYTSGRSWDSPRPGCTTRDGTNTTTSIGSTCRRTRRKAWWATKCPLNTWPRWSATASPPARCTRGRTIPAPRRWNTIDVYKRQGRGVFIITKIFKP